MNAITIYLIAACFVGGGIHSALEQAHPDVGDLFTAVLALVFAVLICRFLFRREIFLRV